MTMRGAALIIAACILPVIIIPGSASRADPLNIPPMPEDELKRSIIYYKEGEVGLEDVAIAQRMLYWEAPSILQFHFYWQGEGDNSRPQLTVTEERHNGTSAEYTFSFSSGDHYVMERYTKVVKDLEGEVVQKELRDFSHPIYNYPEDLTHVYTIEYCLRGLDMERPGYKQTFHLWLPPTGVIPMTAEVRGIETITLHNGRKYTCRVVEIRPDMVQFLGPVLGRLIRPFLATYTFWYETQGTHPTIRYTGPMGKINTGGVPTEIYEMISIKQKPEGSK
jgi:hypothetical protein